MSLYEEILEKTEKVSIVGLGYVGLPLAVAFAKKVEVIGFDLNKAKIEKYKQGFDPTNEVGDEVLKKTLVDFTDQEERLREAKFHIVTVPTPINSDKTPDLLPVENASKLIGRNLKAGAIVVYESTVYPGVTEDVCIPILEKESGMKCGKDFKVGYSPERINPGDKVNKLENIKKIVSGIDAECLEVIAKIYEIIIKAGVHRANSIKIAEAAKVVENSQRDINIAFMNELAMVFNKMGIDTREVIDAMNTKWNALKFYPGLVGGHCISIDPYYFLYKAEKLGYHSQIIISGRKINDGMGKYVADAIIKQLILADKNVKRAKVGIFGITFKENTSDIRNSKVIDIISNLKEFDVVPIIVDELADEEELKKEYDINLDSIDNLENLDCAVFAVAHDCYKKMSWDVMDSFFGESARILIDVKGVFDPKEAARKGYLYWSL